MTTIVYDGYDLAADRLVTSATMRHGYMKKIIRLERGGYVAGAGDAFASKWVAEWLDGHRDAPPDDLMKDSEVLYVAADGTGTLYDGTCSVGEPIFDTEVCGTGSPYAKAVLLHGGTAKEACQIASRLDTGSGGKIDVVHVIPRPKKVKEIDTQNSVS